MISIVFPHAINPQNDALLQLKIKMLEENSTYPYEVLYLANNNRPDLVYKGWDFLIRNAKYDLVLWDNTDIVYAPNWMDNIIKHKDDAEWICIQLIECGAIGVHSNNIYMPFGLTADKFMREEFEYYANWHEKQNKSILRESFCWYSPSVFHKDKYIELGGFNIEQPFPTQNDVEFRERAEKAGWRFITVNSYAYHFQRGHIHQGLEEERK